MDSQPPVSMQSSAIGLREVGLLLLAAAFGLMMLDLLNIAVVAGWLALGVWGWAMIRGPRPSPGLTAVFGGGAVLITFWWPDGNWWFLAVPLLWTGIALIVGAIVSLVARSLMSSHRAA